MEEICLVLKEAERISEIFIGVHLLDFVVKDLRERPLGNRLGIITDSHVETLLGKGFKQHLVQEGIKADLVVIRPGEESKRWETVQSIFEWMAAQGFDRKSSLLSLGGGVVGDITGFVSSLYMRSIPYVQIPTTLLAQVDSSLGGKTAIDLPLRKNLLGTFYQPSRVYIDPSLLKTLSLEEIRNGLAEVIKSAIIRDRELFEFLESHPEGILQGEGEVTEKIVSQCCRIKSAVVMEDEIDLGLRQILNFGHTVGHAIEAYTDYAVSHGKAVSMGISSEACLSARMGLLPIEEKERILKLLKDYGLPTEIPKSYDRDRIIGLMRSDKKAENGKIAVVLPTAIGSASVKKGVPVSLIKSALQEVEE